MGDLKARLTQFWEKHYSAQPPAHVQWWYRRSWQHGLASLAMATLLWVIFAYRPETVYRTFIVPVELRNLESEWRLDDSVPTEARVTLIGSEQAYRGLDPSSLIISLNLSEIEEGTNEFIITEENLQQLPSNIRLYNVSPRAVAIEAQPQRVVTVPVEVPTVGTLPDSLELVSLRPDPRNAALAVPESTGRAPEQVLTEPVDLGKITGSTRLRRKLAPGIDVRLGSQQSQEVTVDVEVRLRPPDSR